MTLDELKVAMEYGSPGSQVGHQKSLRGFFGRGLKESIIAFGFGEVRTIKNGKACAAELDYKKGSPQIRFTQEFPLSEKPTDWMIQGCGTEVLIKLVVTPHDRHKIRKPEDTVANLSQHFALIEILKRRRIALFATFQHGPNLIRDRLFSIEAPKLDLTMVEQRHLEDNMILHIFESEQKLNVERNSHYSQAGVTILSESIPLDHIHIENGHPGMPYFRATLECPELAKLLRKDFSDFLSSDRTGLSWKTERCKRINKLLEEYLIPHFERRCDTSQQNHEPPEELKKNLQELTAELNKIARELLTELHITDTESRELGNDPIDRLVIRPTAVNIMPNAERTLTAYIPKKNVLQLGLSNRPLEVVGTITELMTVKLQKRSVPLQEHQNRNDILVANMILKATQIAVLGSRGKLIIQVGDEHASAIINIRDQGTKPTSTNTGSGKGKGIISKIELNNTEDPTCPVRYDSGSGKLSLYTEFPGVKGIIDADGNGLKTDKGLLICSNLLMEGLSRAVILEKIAKGELTDSANDTLLEYDDIRKQYANKIYKLVRIICSEEKK